MQRWRKGFMLHGAAALGLTIASIAQAQSEASSHWAEGFAHPPASARPHVWWHWMNGNVDADGARRDLDWMAASGIAEAHIFEGGMGTPTIIPERRSYMSPEWQEVLRASMDQAGKRGMTLGIATSPGWSATGGPWVKPEDAMKKLVWSETLVDGGHALHLALPQPPSVAGPFQDVPMAMVSTGHTDAPSLYGDARVLAMPVTASPLPVPQITVSGGPAPTATALSNGRFADSFDLPATADGAWIAYHYDTPQTVRAALAGVPARSGFGTPNPALATLEASDDGEHWRQIASFAANAPSSLSSPAKAASFAPVTANWFRLRLKHDPAPGFIDHFTFAPGALRPPFNTAPPASFAVSEFTLSAEGHVNRAIEQAGFATLSDYTAAATPEASGPAPQSVIDISRFMAADGTLNWTPPPGRWRILRMGWSLTGHHNDPAPDEATGLEVDKLSAPRVAAYLDHYLGLYAAALGKDAFGPKGLSALLSDSIEAGPQNWTETLPAEFARRRGYDPTPWLPTLAGYVVGDARSSDGFLHDWRQTIGDLYAEAYYGTIAQAAHARGMTLSAEALEDHRPQLGDDMTMRARADVPMGAMWTIAPDAEAQPTYRADLKGAASVANVYGRSAVAAESMSAFGHPWGFAPADLKRTVDAEFALGVNRIHIHESAHQPLPDAAPGLALATFLGQYFNRNETWAPMADGWISYLARSSYLLQQGHHDADIACFYGEDAPLTSLYGDRVMEQVPAGHDYDFLNREGLLTRISVRDGQLVTPDGQSWRALYLGGDSGRMSLPVLRKIRDLLQAGATVIGPRPSGSPSLADDPGEVSATIAAIWGDGKNPAISPHLHEGREMAPALRAEAIAPDWIWQGSGALTVLHRKAGDGDIWFVSNPSSVTAKGAISLRGAGLDPELWHAETGRVEAAGFTAAHGRTEIPLALASGEAVFVVMRRPTTLAHRAVSPRVERPLMALTDGWSVTYQSGRGAPAGESATGLTDWSQSPEAGIRYFSGIGTYRRSLTLPRGWAPPQGRLSLDLGQVHDVADVTVNGHRAGVAWRAPYQVDVTGLLHTGTNTISVRVANLWVNRLIGDAQPGAKKITHVTGPTYAADAPLRPSGLLGPVRLMAAPR
ncbi:glycosyl hydrolase [Novosphingobium sp.]|uniref:glycosyl hydrolase n=1 Tax=Novosphingobium sp. TaxID=1874826 RepID=UPI0031D0D37B